MRLYMDALKSLQVMLLLFGQSCSDTDFSSEGKYKEPQEETVEKEPDPEPTLEAKPAPKAQPKPVPEPEPLPDISCKNKDLHKTNEVNITFPSNLNLTRQCKWGMGGSPTIADLENDIDTSYNAHFSAMRRESHEFSIPDNASICNLTLEMEESRFIYDDHIFLLAENFIIASSHELTINNIDYFEKTSENLFRFDHEKILGKPFLTEPDAYCASSGPEGCIIPKSDVEGNLFVEIDKDRIEALTDSRESKNSLSLSLVSYGDNDPDDDCEHSELNLKLKLVYIENPGAEND